MTRKTHNDINGSNGNAAEFFVDSHVPAGRGDKVAFREVDGQKRSISYSKLGFRSSAVAAALIAAGISYEQRAAMLLLDTIEYPQLFWGALKAGVVAVPINTLLATSIYEKILTDSRATALFVSSDLYQTIKPALVGNKFIKLIVVVGDNGVNGLLGFDEFIRGHEPAEVFDASPDDVAFWLYSSGSTGEPKGVKHVHSSLKSTYDTYGKNVLGITASDIVFSAAKIFFAYGLGNSMTFPMAVGATTLLVSGRPTPNSVLEILTHTKPSLFFGVPTLFAALLNEITQVENLKTGLRLCISAGEALPAPVGAGWREKTGVDILDGVGSTEMLHIYLSNKQDNIVYGTSGVVVPGYELRLLNEAGQEVGADEIGELVVSGPSASDGYWNQREKSRNTFEGVWTRTGDKYERSSEGRLIYCGRNDDMFKVSGIWVAPFEVEQAISAHQSVVESAVVPEKDDDGLLKPKAYVVVRDEADVGGLAELLKEHVKSQIGKWKYPRWIEFVNDLPKTATGKIQRFKLREK